MRALFEDIPSNYGEVSRPSILVTEVVLPQNSSRRDLWFVFERSGSANLKCNVVKNRTDTVANRIATATIPIGDAAQDVTFTRYGTATPDVTGLVIRGVFSAQIGSTGQLYVWGYTASPDLVVCDNIVVMLQEYTTAGMSLESVDPNYIFVGDDTEARALPAINVISKPGEMILSDSLGSCMAMQIPIEVHVGVESLGEPVGAWRSCRALMAAVESILHDEHRTCYGETRLWRTGAQGPGPAPGQSTVMVGVVTLMSEFLHVWRDDQAVRG